MLSLFLVQENRSYLLAINGGGGADTQRRRMPEGSRGRRRKAGDRGDGDRLWAASRDVEAEVRSVRSARSGSFLLTCAARTQSDTF